jgi:hypothetical protein
LPLAQKSDATRCLGISHRPLGTDEIILIRRPCCGMLAFADDLIETGPDTGSATRASSGLRLHCAHDFVYSHRAACPPVRLRATDCDDGVIA